MSIRKRKLMLKKQKTNFVKWSIIFELYIRTLRINFIYFSFFPANICPIGMNYWHNIVNIPNTMRMLAKQFDSLNWNTSSCSIISKTGYKLLNGRSYNIVLNRVFFQSQTKQFSSEVKINCMRVIRKLKSESLFLIECGVNI